MFSMMASKNIHRKKIVNAAARIYQGYHVFDGQDFVDVWNSRSCVWLEPPKVVNGIGDA